MNKWGRVPWFADPTLQVKKKRGRNIGEWSEAISILHCLSNPKILLDGSVKTIKAVEHNGIAIPTSAIQNLDIEKIERLMYGAINVKQDGGGSFDIDDEVIKDALDKFGMIESIKGSSANKHDIILHTAEDKDPLYFNIKSLLGGNPSIVNASKQTSIRFSLKNPRQNDISVINKSLAGISVFSEKIKYLRTISDDIVSGNYTSDAYYDVLSDLDEYAFLYMSEWLLSFFENKTHDFLTTHHDTEWFNRFVILSMTKIRPKVGSASDNLCGLAFLYNSGGRPSLKFTMGADPVFKKELCKFVRFDRPSFSRHKQYMLEKLDEDFSFRLPIQLRLQSALKDTFK